MIYNINLKKVYIVQRMFLVLEMVLKNLINKREKRREEGLKIWFIFQIFLIVVLKAVFPALKIIPSFNVVLP